MEEPLGKLTDAELPRTKTAPRHLVSSAVKPERWGTDLAAGKG